MTPGRRRVGGGALLAMVAVCSTACSGSKAALPLTTSTTAGATTTAPHPPTASVPTSPAGPTFPPPSLPPAGTRFNVPSSIPATCSASSPDETAALQAFVNSVPNDATIVFPSSACYRVEGTILVSKRHDLTFEGNGTTLRSFTNGRGFVSNLATRHHVFCYGGSDLAFTGLNIVGDNTAHTYNAAYDGQSGWWVWGTRGLTLSDDTVSDVLGDFVTIGPNTYRSWQWATDVTIADDTFDGSGRQGISITGAENVTIDHNRLSHVPMSAFDIEPDSGTGPLDHGIPTYGGAQNVTIAENQVGKSGTTFLSDVGADGKVSNVTVEYNTLVGEPLFIIASGSAKVPRTGLRILDNTSTGYRFGSPAALIQLTYETGGQVSGNRASFSSSERTDAVQLQHTSSVSITGNAFEGAATGVVVSPSSSQVTITGNTGALVQSGPSSTSR